jgi:hypothetical protein
MDNPKKIVKIKKNEDGEITDVMLEDERILPMNQAILMAKDYLIEGTNVTRGKNGGEFLRTDPEYTGNNNIASLPTFKN